MQTVKKVKEEEEEWKRSRTALLRCARGQRQEETGSLFTI